MRQHIVIEGPDGAGKTHLARLLVEALGMDYHHEGPPPTDVHPFDHYWRVLDELKRPTVIDRFHLGETVYGPLLRGGTKLNRAAVWDLSLRVINNGGFIVLCLPPWETCIENNRQKEELIKDEGMLRRAYDAWETTARVDGWRTFDYTKVMR